MILRIKDQFKERSNAKDVMWLMLLSLAVKVLLLGFEQVINPDGVGYIAAAQQLAAGNIQGSLKLYPMPAYPFLLALVHFVIPDWVLAARTIGILSLVLASLPLYGITRILFNRQAAFWSIIFLALSPEANDQALSVLRDPVFLLIALTAIWYFLKGLREQNTTKIVAALLLSIASLFFRVEGIVLILASTIYFAIKGIRSEDMSLKIFFRRSLIIWIGVFILAGIVGSLVFGPKLLSQNQRVVQLATEANKVIHFKAFKQYNERYDYIKSIETEPPFSGKSKSLLSIVRHWMPLIYLIGILEYFVKQLFPLLLIPLLWAVFHNFYHNRSQPMMVEKQYILIVVIIYIFLILYTFMVRDSMQGRFLFTPAVLFFPWVGQGMTLILNWLTRIKYSLVLRITFVFVFLVAPCVKTIRTASASDNNILTVGEFISEDPRLVSKNFLFSDARYWLYSKRTDAFTKILRSSKRIYKHLENGQIKAIEEEAIRNNADALVLFVNHNQAKNMPEFEHYEIYKRFVTRKGVTGIYRLRES